jgi:hypothetical protein
MTLTAEALLEGWFLPLYPEDVRRDLARARTEDRNPANNPSLTAHLDEAAAVFANIAGRAIGAPDLTLDYTDASIHRLSAALTRDVRDRLASAGEKGTPESELFNVVIHGAAYVGACVVRNHGGAWSVRRPLWESVVHLRSRAGEADLAVFHWWLKALSDDATATLADRYRTNVEVPCAEPEKLAPIAPADRKLPRMAKVRYDVLHKYLRANLPELRDLGEHFPSPERFDELGLESLSLSLVGDGRMLVMHGPSKSGLHAFWLTKEGFEKAAFWPCDAFPAPILRPKDDKLEVVLSKDGKVVSFELLWWGP